MYLLRLPDSAQYNIPRDYLIHRSPPPCFTASNGFSRSRPTLGFLFALDRLSGVCLCELVCNQPMRSYYSIPQPHALERPSQLSPALAGQSVSVVTSTCRSMPIVTIVTSTCRSIPVVISTSRPISIVFSSFQTTRASPGY